MHKRILQTFGIFFVFAGICASALLSHAQTVSSTPSQSASRQELEAQITNKAKELEAINQQVNATKQSLSQTQNQRVSLQKELTTLQSNIINLNLHIKADQISIEKLGLEIESLNYDMRDIDISTVNKKTAVIATLKALQQKDESPLLVQLLMHSSLADDVLEVQAFTSFQGQLSRDITSLHDLHDQYAAKVEESNKKKGQADAHRQDLQTKKVIVQDQQDERTTLLKETKNKESVYQQQLTDLKKKQQQIAGDIEALDAILRTKIDPSSLPSSRAGVLGIPLQGANQGDVTQGYGATDFAKYGYAGHWHNGLDFGAAIGDPILAAEDGTVAGVGNTDSYCPRGSYGRFVVINHDNNLTTLYAHMSRQAVQVGQRVTRGQVIGYAGKTGYATGPHLHFTVFAKATFYIGPSKVCGPQPYGGDLNPAGYLW